MTTKLWQWHQVTAIGEEAIIKVARAYQQHSMDYCDDKPIETVREAEHFFLMTELGHVSFDKDDKDV